MSILDPEKIFRKMHAQEFEALDSVHHRPIDIDRCVDPHLSSSKVHNQFLDLTDNESQVVALAPFGQSSDLPSPKDKEMSLICVSTSVSIR